MRLQNPVHGLLLLGLSACSVEIGGLGPVADAGQDMGSTGANPDQGTLPPASGPSTDPWSGAMPGPDDADVIGQPVEVDAGEQRQDASLIDAGTSLTPDAQRPLPFTLTSPDLAEGAKMPTQFTCSGGHQTPAFAWTGAPADTHSFALVLTTPTTVLGSEVPYTRWAIWNIAAERVALPAEMALPEALQVSNESDLGIATGGFLGGGGSDGEPGHRYRGPCSRGFQQKFVFTLYALASTPDYPAGWDDNLTTDEVLSWLQTSAQVLGRASLSGVAP